MTIKFFPYSWHIDNKQTEITSIRTYGLNENNESVCLQIDDFKPYAYIELPTHIRWTSTNVKYVQREIDKMLGNRCPLVWKFVYKKKLYGAYLNSENNREEFPYLYCAFSNRKDAKILEYKLNKTDSRTGSQSTIYVSGGIGHISLKLHETDADPILQLTCCRKITTSSWLKCKGVEVNSEDRITSCHHEYSVEWEQIDPYDCNQTPKPVVMGFDIEVNSSNPSKMPDASDPRDEIFQISCVISSEGKDDKKYIFSLGDPIQEMVGIDVTIVKCASESKLLSYYCDLIKDEKVNIISGYNILGFDIPYMINRAELNNLGKFAKQGFANVKAEQKTIKWSSSAYGTQEFEFLDAEGRLYVDLLPLVRRDYKFNNYKLKTISEYFIGATKDPLSVQGIFKCYRLGTAMDENGGYSIRARKAISICAKYCVQDSVLVVRLMEKLKTWVGLTEMASICNVPIFALYTQGQQIKVYSQIYRFCMEQNIVVEKDGYKTLATDRYIGAKVFPPKPGIYNYIVPFDFASLYPTTIIAYNIDYHTWVPDDSDIPDSKCHVMEWEDHLGCIHDPNVIRKLEIDKIVDQKKVEIDALRKQRDSIKDKVYKKQLQTQIAEETEKLKPYREERSEIQKALPKICMCAKRRYRFLKEPKGVLPTIIQDLLDSRKRVRKVNMKACYKKLEELEQQELETGIDNSEKIIAVKTEIDVLDKRQLAMKVSANSMYGAMGVRRGYLPFMPGAMCFEGGTLVSTTSGLTKKIEDIHNDSELWGCSENQQIVASCEGSICNGKKKLLKITLQDGRTLRCTPDHRIMTTTGWVEAQDLISKHKWDGTTLSINENNSKIVGGLELPEDTVCPKEKTWSLLDYNMKTQTNREKALAFSRVLGFVLTDGTISKYVTKHDNKLRYSSSVNLGCMISANLFLKDIELLCGKVPQIRNSESGQYGSTFSISIPSILTKQFIQLEGIVVGKRTHNPYTLPSFILEEECPKSIVREFLGGMFGGDGTSPSLSKRHPSFAPIQLGWTTIEKHNSTMATTMENMIMLLNKFDIPFTCKKYLSRIRESKADPQDLKENPRYYFLISTLNNQSLKFANSIGFRYDIDKTNKLSIAASYQRYSDNVKQQHNDVVLTASKLKDEKGDLYNMEKCSLEARKIVYANSVPLNIVNSLPPTNHIYNHRSRPDSLEKFKLLKKHFPTATEYTEMIGCRHWFSNKKGDGTHSIDRNAMSVECYNLDVIDVREDGEDFVYDIVNTTTENFMANGVVVHNCTTYMGRVNIDKVAKTIPEKYGGELVYGD